ncbi:BSD domain-containing protein 1 [Tyrophagus putrescentiae]|nr:BSD domain-containing protein 1 [Tyrophagus putrescentiae]
MSETTVDDPPKLVVVKPDQVKPTSEDDKASASATTIDEATPEQDEEEGAAQSEPPSSSFGGWFSSMVQTAKDTVSKSAGSTLENIKRDLSELKDAVQTDATSMMYSTASIVKSKLNEIGNTVNEIGSLGTIEVDDEDADEEEGLLEKAAGKGANEEEGAEVDDQKKKKKSGRSTTTNKKSPSTSKKASVSSVAAGESTEGEKAENEMEEEEGGDGESPFPNTLDTLNNWTNILTDRAKSTISLVRETLVESIFVSGRDDLLLDEEEPFVLKDGQVVPIENWKALLHGLQINPDTYCREPSGPPEEFRPKQMEHLLDTVPEVLKLHTNLVPRQLSDSDFWHRYYYKVHQLREVQKELILQSSETTTSNETSAAAAASSSKKHPNSSNVNIRYLNEKSTGGGDGSGDASRADSDSKISRSSTEDWEKMTDRDEQQTVAADKSSRGSSDEDRDWVKYD